MRVVDAIAETMRREGVEYLPCYPTTPMIEAAAAVGIKPVVCRQERVGVGIADGYSRVTNGRRLGAFAMQYGPGAENAFPGVATAYSDAVPVLLLPLGHPTDRAGSLPHFHSITAYEPITKSTEQVNVGSRVPQIMRRAFSNLRIGRLGPVMIEIPADVAVEEVDESAFVYQNVKPARSSADPSDVDKVAQVLIDARNLVLYAGQGILYAEASNNLVELAELLGAPVMTTLAGKSGFPENHRLALGTGSGTSSAPAVHFLQKADVVCGIGSSFTKHGMCINIPCGKIMIQATNEPRDINKDYTIDHPLIGDAQLVLGQLIEAVKERLGTQKRTGDEVAHEIKSVNDQWLQGWMPKLTSEEVPINPYRVIWELMQAVDPAEAIVTHDSGSPRNQMVPFYIATTPRSYTGWGKSHGLGTGLGLTIGAKLASPDKFCINWMGDAAFGMVGLDFETAVRCNIPILTIVSNNFSMAIETSAMQVSHKLYQTRTVGGNYADLAQSLGGWSERVTNPSDVGPAIHRARRATENGQAALLEFITCQETNYSLSRAL